MEPAATAFGLVIFFGYLSCPCVQRHARLVPAVHQPDGRSAAVHARDGLSRCRAGGPCLVGRISRMVAMVSAAVARLLAPALAIAFRATCYYYRGAYYKAFFLTPPSCAVGGVSRRYRGETRLWLFQNLHRYALYGGVFLLVCLWWEGSPRSSATAGSASASAPR